MREYVSIEDAVTLLLKRAEPVSAEMVAITEADRRVLAEDVVASVELPPFNRSAYDGFAMHSADTKRASAGNPAKLPVVGMVAAGDFWSETLPEGRAIRIMTGAALPEGADCVINFERVTEENGSVCLTTPIAPWKNVDRAGDELRVGTKLFQAGELLTPAHLGVFASQGADRIRVCRKPRAAILSTGSELAMPGENLSAGKIYNSNLFVLRAYLEREGYRVTECTHLSDDETAIRDALRRLSQNNDLILTTGGASVGDRDFAESALTASGAEILFARVRMKPGSCCFGACLDKTLIVSFSGNPGAALTSYFRVALPAVRKIAGRRDHTLREQMLALREDYRKTCPSPRILKGHTEIVDGATVFIGHEGQKNGMQTSFLHMDALAELPPTDTLIGAGTLVRVFFPEA